MVTREFATSMQRSHSILLKDNPELKPLFEWLKNLGINTFEDMKFPKLTETMHKIKFDNELKVDIDADVPMLVFHNVSPLQGDFSNGIPKYLKALYEAMYSPEAIL